MFCALLSQRLFWFDFLSLYIYLYQKQKYFANFAIRYPVQGKETEIQKSQNQVEETLEMKAKIAKMYAVQKQIIEKLSKDLETLYSDKEKMEAELNDKLQGKDFERDLLQSQFAEETFKLNDIIGKLRKYIDTLLEKLK